MQRSTFLLLSGLIALVVGLFALFAPAILLASKGISSAAANVWVQEVGVILMAVGILVVMVRHHEDSPTLKAILISNIVIQIGLFTIEVLAYHDGIITLLSGVVPNLTLHIFLAGGLVYYLAIMRNSSSSTSY